MTDIQYRKFGVEIELIGLTQSRATVALTDAGISAYDAGYTHARSSRWKVVSDASLSNRDGTGTCEVVSPVMAGGNAFEASIAAVRTTANVLKSAGATVNQSCGLHVHIDAAGLTGADIARIVERYTRFEAEIDQWMPRSRRGNNGSFCHSMSTWRVPSGSATRTAAAVCSAMHDRFMKVNLQSYARHGTIEFRHHSGTVDPDKIEHWVRFLQSFVHASRGGGASGTVLDNVVAALNASEALLLAALQEGGPCTMEHLRYRSQLSLNSMQASLSALRKKGYDIRWDRARSVYKLIGNRAVTHVPTSELNYMEDRIVSALRSGNRTASSLMEHTGLTLDSLRCTISTCRRKGYQIKFSRRENVYFLTGFNPLAARVRTHKGGGITPEGFAAPAAADTALDTVWTAVPTDTRLFLEARAAALAEHYNTLADSRSPINRLTGRPPAISGDTLDAEAAGTQAGTLANSAGWEAAIAYVTALHPDERQGAINSYDVHNRHELMLRVDARLSRIQRLVDRALREHTHRRAAFVWEATNNTSVRQLALAEIERRERSAAELERAMSSPTPTLF